MTRFLQLFVVLLIALAGHDLDAPGTRIVYTLKSCKSDGLNAQVKSFGDELSLIRAFLDDVRHLDPDVITGFNILQFDFPYLIRRMQVLVGPDAFTFPSRTPTGQCSIYLPLSPARRLDIVLPY